ncbi:MAG: hypothetical protein L7F78_12525 [Syntrophales bacterium LBB04]|nr:hypothetical protein [Syntrophales bacterium LBB04]
MCLTPEAYSERKWGPFPVLRKALEDKQVPFNYYGPTTAGDNMFDAVHRLMEISVLTSEYESDIKEKAMSLGREEMYRDLRQLEEALEQASYFFKRTIDKVRTLYSTL